MDWLNDARADGLDKGRPPETPHQRRNGGALLAALALLVVAALALWLLTRPDADQEPSGVPATAAPAQDQAPASSSPEEAPTSSSPPVPSPSATANLTGAPLAHAWLRAYLTRPTGGQDTSWSAAIEPYSDPELVTTLRSAEDLGDLNTWSSMSVKSITADSRTHAPSTPTRQISGWVVELTDGKTTKRVPYMLTAYVDANGRWTVAQAEQGYTSEG